MKTDEASEETRHEMVDNIAVGAGNLSWTNLVLVPIQDLTFILPVCVWWLGLCLVPLTTWLAPAHAAPHAPV